MAFEAADQIRRQERIDARLRRVHDEMPETRQRHAGWAALVDQRGDAGVHADQIGIHAETAADIAVHMGVGVDHARQHDTAAQVDGLLGAARQNVFCTAAILPSRTATSITTVEVRGGADDMAAAQQHVIRSVVGHSGLRRQRR